MEIKLLKSGYKNEKFYQDFLDDKVNTDEYISDESVNINSIPDIPVYLGNFKKSSDDELKIEEFSTMIDILINDFLDLNEDIYMDELFWHSYLCLYKRDYLLNKYPEIKEGFNKFKLVVMKDFDWENYLYKAVLAAKYIVEPGEEANKDKYARLIMENLDIYNYIIKYNVSKNGNFVKNILDIIDETGLSKLLKSKIKDSSRTDLGKDERYGRRVMFEFNKSYPVVLSPMLDKEELKKYVFKFLSYYYDGDLEEFKNR